MVSIIAVAVELVRIKGSFFSREPSGRISSLSIVLLIDQKDTAGIDVKLFNKITKTQIGFLKIARKHNLKLIPVKNTRYNINNFSIKFYPPIKPFEKSKSDAEAMLYIHKIIEEWILENPTQWLWQHNRFN